MTIWVLSVIVCFLVTLLVKQLCVIRENRLKDEVYVKKKAFRDLHIELERLRNQQSYLDHSKVEVQNDIHQLEQEIMELQSQLKELEVKISDREEEQAEMGGQGTQDEANSERPSHEENG